MDSDKNRKPSDQGTGDTKALDDDVLDIHAGKMTLSQEFSEDRGQSKEPSGILATEIGTEGKVGSETKVKKRRNICGAEKKRRRKARLADVQSQSAPNRIATESGMSQKRGRSPNREENVTPPQKRSLNVTPPAAKDQRSGTSSVPQPEKPESWYRGAISESLTFVIVGTNGTALSAGQVELVRDNLVYELNQFIGSNVKAPGFNGRRMGEEEFELLCADGRSVAWLKAMVPKLRPWREASLMVMPKREWIELNKPGKMTKLSVLVPWNTSAEYFLNVLRTDNQELRTLYWEIKYVQERDESTLFLVKVDERSLEILQAWNFKAYWLMDVLTFRVARNRNPLVKKKWK